VLKLAHRLNGGIRKRPDDPQPSQASRIVPNVIHASVTIRLKAVISWGGFVLAERGVAVGKASFTAPTRSPHALPRLVVTKVSGRELARA
jgi:hypothetical protein